MTDQDEDPLDLGAQAAETVMAVAAELPDGVQMVVFLIVKTQGGFETILASTAPPEVIGPVLGAWLERFNAGNVGMVKMWNGGPVGHA